MEAMDHVEYNDPKIPRIHAGREAGKEAGRQESGKVEEKNHSTFYQSQRAIHPSIHTFYDTTLKEGIKSLHLTSPITSAWT